MGVSSELAASAEHKHSGDTTMQRHGPRDSGMCLVRSECSVLRAGAWKTSGVMEVLSTEGRPHLRHVGNNEQKKQ